MTTEITLAGQKVRLSARYLDTVTDPWKVKNPPQGRVTTHNKFRVSVLTDRARSSFSFYGSHNDYQAGITELDAEELLGAFECFLSDGCAGNDTFDSFCADMGYDQDSRTAERTWKVCVKAKAKADRLGIDVYEALEALKDAKKGVRA